MEFRSIGFLFFSLSLLLIGCQQEESREAGEATENTSDYFLQVENLDPTSQSIQTNQEIADHLAELASSVPNINGANSLVAGPYSIVAIDVDSDLDRTRVGTIKYAVSEALYHDPYGKTAVVVADADIAARIKGIRAKIDQGYPIQGVIDELAAIVGRNMPEFPTNEHQPIEPDQNKEILDEEEENQLEDIEQKQN